MFWGKLVINEVLGGVRGRSHRPGGFLEEVDGNTLGVRAGKSKGGVIIKLQLPSVACQDGGGGLTSL